MICRLFIMSLKKLNSLFFLLCKLCFFFFFLFIFNWANLILSLCFYLYNWLLFLILILNWFCFINEFDIFRIWFCPNLVWLWPVWFFQPSLTVTAVLLQPWQPSLPVTVESTCDSRVWLWQPSLTYLMEKMATLQHPQRVI